MPLADRLMGWAVRNRSRMPRWVDRAMSSAARNPDGFVGQVAGRLLGGGGGAPVTTVPDRPVRVYIAPTNYAGQGCLWARALEATSSDIGARNMAIELPGGFSFPADTLVPIAAVNTSTAWAEAEWNAARRFTHVLVEAERPMFGRRFGRSLPAEVQALHTSGVSVAYLAHGTDVRDPDRHRTRTPWSPYPEDPRTDELRVEAAANLALLAEAEGPVFVSTPDLLADVPGSVWCPVVIDVDRFRSDRIPFTDERAHVMHSSSSAVQKGSDTIEPALAAQCAAGVLDLRLVTGVSSVEMPAIVGAADIVVDQFRLGSYGVAACEAMAAGRLVVGHVLPDVREAVRAATGLELPIVEATPDTLADVVAAALADVEGSRRTAAAGVEFARAVHGGAFSAQVLRSAWIDRG